MVLCLCFFKVHLKVLVGDVDAIYSLFVVFAQTRTPGNRLVAAVWILFNHVCCTKGVRVRIGAYLLVVVDEITSYQCQLCTLTVDPM